MQDPLVPMKFSSAWSPSTLNSFCVHNNVVLISIFECSFIQSTVIVPLDEIADTQMVQEIFF